MKILSSKTGDPYNVYEQIASTIEFAKWYCQQPKWKPGDPKFDDKGTNIGYASYMGGIQTKLMKMCESCPHSVYHPDWWMDKEKYIGGVPAHRTCQKLPKMKDCFDFKTIVESCPVLDNREEFDYFIKNRCL